MQVDDQLRSWVQDTVTKELDNVGVEATPAALELAATIIQCQLEDHLFEEAWEPHAPSALLSLCEKFLHETINLLAGGRSRSHGRLTSRSHGQDSTGRQKALLTANHLLHLVVDVNERAQLFGWAPTREPKATV